MPIVIQCGRADDACIAQITFSDKSDAVLEGIGLGMDLDGEFLEKWIGGLINNGVYGIKTQGLDMAVSNPVQSILNKIPADLITLRPTKIQRLSPGRLVALRK
jgi:hypothetical protein